MDGKEISFNCKNESNSAICNNMDGTGWHHVEWNKLHTERQVPYVGPPDVRIKLYIPKFCKGRNACVQ